MLKWDIGAGEHLNTQKFYLLVPINAAICFWANHLGTFHRLPDWLRYIRSRTHPQHKRPLNLAEPGVREVPIRANSVIISNPGIHATPNTCRPSKAFNGSSSWKESCMRIPKSDVTNKVVTFSQQPMMRMDHAKGN